MTQIFAIILGIANAIPIIDQWIQKFSAWYVQQKLTEMNIEDITSLQNALNFHNQIDLEKQIGDQNAGNPSNIPGSSIVDSLPGLSKPTDQKSS